jgi:hypothetical protein
MLPTKIIIRTAPDRAAGADRPFSTARGRTPPAPATISPASPSNRAIERAPEKPDHRSIDHRCRSSSQIARPRQSSRRPRLPLLATALRRHRWSGPSLSRRPSQQPLKIREALALRPTTSPRSRAWPSGRNRPAGPASPRRRRQPSRSLGPAALRVGPASNSSTRRLGSALRRVAKPCRRRTARPRS